jgi:hypothetical protein
MSEQRNLTEDNVNELTGILEKMQENNPDLEYRFFEQEHNEEEKDEQPSNKEIFEKLEAIERQLKMIFDGHVLINGWWLKSD